jgi:hypothetical protein
LHKVLYGELSDFGYSSGRTRRNRSQFPETLRKLTVPHKDTMAHEHYCDVAGHRWTCDSDECECICDTPMNEGDHSACPIELRACPEHEHGLAPDSQPVGGVPIEFPHDFDEKLMRAVEQASISGAACLWCGYGYPKFSMKAQHEHLATCAEYPEEGREQSRKRLLEIGHDDDDCESSDWEQEEEKNDPNSH